MWAFIPRMMKLTVSTERENYDENTCIKEDPLRLRGHRDDLLFYMGERKCSVNIAYMPVLCPTFSRDHLRAELTVERHMSSEVIEHAALIYIKKIIYYVLDTADLRARGAK